MIAKKDAAAIMRLPNAGTRVLVDDPLCGPTLGVVVGHRDDPDAPLQVLLDGDDIAGAYAAEFVHRALVPRDFGHLARFVESVGDEGAIVVRDNVWREVAGRWLVETYGHDHDRRVVVIPGARP